MAPPPPAPGTGGGGLPGSGWDGTPAPGDWGLGVGTDWGVPGQIAAYFTSRGVTPAPTSVAYWEDKWNQWGKADPKTFFERLAQADEFGGQNPHPEGGGAGGQFLGSAEGTALFNMLMKTAGEGLNVNPNDPIIKAQTDAYSATQQRQALAAEQQYAASEGAYGSLGPAIGSLQETAGQNTSGFQATLMGNEVAARRQEIQNALSNATSFLTQEQQLALQRELHLLDLQEQAYQFDTTANNGMLQSLTA